MTILLRARFALILSIFPLIWLASIQPAVSQIFGPISGDSVVSPGIGVQASAPEMLRRLPNVDFDAARSGDRPGQLASYGAQVAPAILDSDAEWIASAIQPASYSEFAGDFGGYKSDGFTLGSCTIVPYGVLWSDMIYSTSRTVPGRFILWVQSDELEGEDTFQIEARYTRVGFDIKGPTLDLFGGITGGGKVEIDFLGNFLTENQPDTRLRHAYWEAKNDYVRFLVGQYWDLVSPRLPNTVNFAVNWGVGNIGFRRAQFRLERYFHLSHNMIWTVQGALAQNVIQDFTGGKTPIGTITRETGNWPMLQGRTALSFGRHCREPVTIGLSGHIGETGFDLGDDIFFPAKDDARFQTWSFNIDAKVPITDRLGLHGEFFTGANLSPLLGGIVQGVCPCMRVPIRSTGGWAELWYDVTPDIHTHLGFGIDNPNDKDSLLGRTNNQVVYGNVFLDVTEHLITGLEVSSWRTTYHNLTNDPDLSPTTPGEAVAIDWTVRYKF